MHHGDKPCQRGERRRKMGRGGENTRVREEEKEGQQGGESGKEGVEGRGGEVVREEGREKEENLST
jgi:hypothetical protein